MRGCLFTLALGAIVVGLIVVIGLPAIAAGVLTAAVGSAGLQADDTRVTVTAEPPTDLLGLHADRVRIQASDATFGDLAIGSLDVTLRDVDLAKRDAGSVDGRLDDVIVHGVPDAGDTLELERIALSGGGDAVSASTAVPGATVERMLADGIEAQFGVSPGAVSLVAPDRVRIEAGPVAATGRLVVRDGGLELRVVDGPLEGRTMTLLEGGSDIPIRLTSATVTPGGDLELSGVSTVGLLG